MLTILIIGIVLALVFDFLNGMNDAANSIATVVSTRVLSPRWAVLWAAAFNFGAVFLLSHKVAATIGKGVVDPVSISPELILAALIGAILWTHFCTRLGLPISVSHSLIGGLIGATLVHAGPDALLMPGIIKIVAFIFISPLFGMLLASILMILTTWVMFKVPKRKADWISRRLQLVSAAAYSLGHGSNDAQKTMGIIGILLLSATAHGAELPKWFYDGSQGFNIPFWVVLSCYTAIALGTITGGWGVIRTLGTKLTKLRPINGFCAETGGAISVLMSSSLGIPVSTTHTIAGSIAGVGLVTNVRAVRWGIASHIVWAWIFTIPMSGLVGAAAWGAYRGFMLLFN